MKIKKTRQEAAINSPLRLPALRASMGDWIYYVSVLRMNDISERISDASEIHSNKALIDLLQRQLTERSKGIAEYLKTQPQRFFNSIVVGVYGGKPEWEELDIRSRLENEEVLPEYYEGVFGILSLGPDTKMWAIDGQHRITGIRKAITQDIKFSEEKVSVIFVSGVNSRNRQDDENGFQRTRRLFTTLNKYAKVVNKKDIIALDEDDISAIITRQLVDEFPGLKEKVTEGNIKREDRTNFTTIEAIFDTVDIIISDRPKPGWKKYKQIRPDDNEIQAYYKKASDFFDMLGIIFEPVGEIYGTTTNSPETIQKYRNMNGGHLLFRPIGLVIVAKTIRQLHDHTGLSLMEAAKRIAACPLYLNEFPWTNLLWNSVSQIMINKYQPVAERVLFYISGGSLGGIKKLDDLDKLTKDYEGRTNTSGQKNNFETLHERWSKKAK